jgi:hypothetical protein
MSLDSRTMAAPAARGLLLLPAGVDDWHCCIGDDQLFVRPVG